MERLFIALVGLMVSIFLLYRFSAVLVSYQLLPIIVQIISGNWGGVIDQNIVTQHPFLIVFCDVVAMVLNIGPWLYVIGRFQKLIFAQQEANMRFAQAIALKDAMTQDALYEAFGDSDEMIKKIEDCFKKGEEVWKPQLAATFGRRQANALVVALNSEIETLQLR